MPSPPPAPAFTPASSLPRPTADPPAPAPAAPTLPSHRNASNAHLPVPSAPPITLHEPDAAPPSTAAVGVDGRAPPAAGRNVNGSEGGKGPEKTSKPVNVPSGSKRSIVVNARQRGNPVVKAIQGVGWEYGDIVPDYQVGANTCVLYLSLKYHRLHPEYLHTRIESIRGTYLLRILLLMCDISEHQEPIREITKICLINEITVITAWSNEEAATYLATYKAFEHKPPDMLKERAHRDYAGQVQAVLTSVRGVNKTDVMTLSTNFGSFKNMAHATPEQLALCPGLGEVKVRRLYDAFNLPFKVGSGGASRPRTKATVPSSMTGSAGRGGGTAGAGAGAAGRSGSIGPRDDQLTLSDVGLSMGLGTGTGTGTNGSQPQKRKRSADEVVVVLDDEDDDDDDDDDGARQPVPQQQQRESPDWPDMGSDAESVGEVGKVWRDPLAGSDDDD